MKHIVGPSWVSASSRTSIQQNRVYKTYIIILRLEEMDNADFFFFSDTVRAEHGANYVKFLLVLSGQQK
jgi:hypothetical protein